VGTSRLLVVGAGAQARYVLNSVRLLRDTTVVGLIDSFENREIWGSDVNGARVLGGLAALDDVPPDEALTVVVAVSNLGRKRDLVQLLTSRGYRFRSVLHPSAVIASPVRIADGCIINSGVVIENGAELGRHVLVHAGAVIEHDNILEDYVNIGPGVRTGGRVRFGEGAIVYTGATVIPNIVIGRETIIGAGAVVIHDVPDGATVAGVPARMLRPA
jgi:sugar O-acyltransferase (sialic acid O-acetyltransferase NeuD family)